MTLALLRSIIWIKQNTKKTFDKKNNAFFVFVQKQSFIFELSEAEFGFFQALGKQTGCTIQIFLVVVVYHEIIVAIGHGLLNKFWPLVIGCVLRTAGSSII